MLSLTATSVGSRQAYIDHVDRPFSDNMIMYSDHIVQVLAVLSCDSPGYHALSSDAAVSSCWLNWGWRRYIDQPIRAAAFVVGHHARGELGTAQRTLGYQFDASCQPLTDLLALSANRSDVYAPAARRSTLAALSGPQYASQQCWYKAPEATSRLGALFSPFQDGYRHRILWPKRACDPRHHRVW